MPLEELATKDYIDFPSLTLEGVKHGTISLSVSWVESTDSDTQVRALVERDPEIRSMLKDVRRQMDLNADGRGGGFGGGGIRAGRGSVLALTGDKTRCANRAADIKTTAANRRLQRKQRSRNSAGGAPAAADDLAGAATGKPLACFTLTTLCGPVMHPESRFRTSWNIMMAMLILYCGVTVPLDIAFDADMGGAMCGYREAAVPRAQCPQYMSWYWLNLVIDMWFIVDIAVNFRTGFIQEGHFVSDDYLSAKQYFKGSFFIDLLGSFPINVVLLALTPDNPYGDVVQTFAPGGEEDGADGSVARLNRIFRFLRFAKLAKLTRMVKLVRYAAEFENLFNPATLTVLKLTVVAILCCHWFGSLWWLVSDMERLESRGEWSLVPYHAPENSWIAPLWLVESEDFGLKYSHALLWGAGMVTAMVPFDIEPVTMPEAYITITAMFIGLLLNAYVISSLTTALTSMNSKKELAGKQLDTIRNYL